MFCSSRICFLFLFWFCFGFGLCLVDGFIIATVKALNHQQCKAVLTFKRQNGVAVLIICKKVCDFWGIISGISF